MRLVRGTALALQYGHRSSIDLDFFGTIDSESEEIREVLRKHGKLLIIKESKNIKITPYPNRKPSFRTETGIQGVVSKSVVSVLF
jgi:hypothetical protein